MLFRSPFRQNIYSLYPAPEGTNFCLKGNAWARYDFDLEMSGRYALAFEFVARTGSDRAIDYAVDNPDDRVFVKLDPCADNNDHRIAMMAAVAAVACKEPVTILGAECVKKSYPRFWEDYTALGGEVHGLISG